VEFYVALPYRTTLDDVYAICVFLAKKPTGATPDEAKKIVDAKLLDFRKIAAYKAWGVVAESDGRLKVTERGRGVAKGDPLRTEALKAVIAQIPAYAAIIERVSHRGDESLTASEVGAHWHEHFSEAVSGNEQILNDQAVCFFQLAQGAGFGQVVIGRKGQPTRFNFSKDATDTFAATTGETGTEMEEAFEPVIKPSAGSPPHPDKLEDDKQTNSRTLQLGQGIFIAHGKNKKPLEQLRRILDQFKVPYRVATEEPNLGRPIGIKVKEVMESCNCAILLFTADEELFDKNGESIWRPNENVIHELGASSYLYGNRIVILKEQNVTMASNYKDLGYISFASDALDAKSIDVLKELIGFGIVKIST
jgi:predicted nucleotide-binding protein